jgi:LmbE family N-acetylglucosaminyl deacetylase
MKFRQAQAEILVPDGRPEREALARTTHLAIGAHPDDLEINMAHGILECFGRADRWFAGVTCTDGAGSARADVYAEYTDAQMIEVRREEQRTAARVGRYGAMIQLAYSSAQVKSPTGRAALVEELVAILRAARPRIVYTHNPADKHATHVAVSAAAIAALRALASDERPERVLGCEGWRDLDWLPDARKVVLPMDAHPSLAMALMGVFDSQIAGGKRYDLAAAGRRAANATFLESHAVDVTDAASFAVDLTPLLADESLTPLAYMEQRIGEFRDEARKTWTAIGGV